MIGPDLDKHRGLYSKYCVAPLIVGSEHDGCEWFVIDHTHDHYSEPFMIAYAQMLRGAEVPDPAVKVQRLVNPEKHAFCRYTVIDINHNEYAVPLLLEYARLCEQEYPKLAVDILKVVGRLKLRYR